jgi:hypothetical protein
MQVLAARAVWALASRENPAQNGKTRRHSAAAAAVAGISSMAAPAAITALVAEAAIAWAAPGQAAW